MKVWNTSNPQQLELHHVLNHRVFEGVAPDVFAAEIPKGPQAPQNPSQMKWLTKSDVGLQVQDGNDLVQDVIHHADMDVPEVTQVSFISKLQSELLFFLKSRLLNACSQGTFGVPFFLMLKCAFYGILSYSTCRNSYFTSMVGEMGLFQRLLDYSSR